jgi:hypothetical protein
MAARAEQGKPLMFPKFSERLDVTDDEHKKIDAMLNRFFERLLLSRGRPTTLYHYTTVAGFHGILSSGVLRATHIAYTNDAIENLHAYQLLLAVIGRWESKTLDSSEGECVEMIRIALEATTAFNTVPIAIACFCESGDQLSQWRAYGQGEGGIAIGFDAASLAFAVQHSKAYLAPVMYDESKQNATAEDLLRAFVSEFFAVLGARHGDARSANMDHWLQVLVGKATLLSAFLKHQGFAEEREWRLVRGIHSIEEISFIQKATHLSPTINLEIGTPRPKKPAKLPVTEVIFGPGRYQDHALHSCGAFLTSLGYVGVPIRKSRTPFRSIA